MSDLKRIEEKHASELNILAGSGERICEECGEEMPCDVVKLARALDEIASLGHNGEVCGVASAYCSACIANSTLAQVAGSEDEHPTWEPVR